MSIRAYPRRWLALLALLALESHPCAGAEPPLWNELSPGAHGVGFRSAWALDYSRRYNTTFDDKTNYSTGKAPRPILVNMWYPAVKVEKARRMPHRGYLTIHSEEPLLAKFSRKLAEYNRDVMAKEMLGKSLKELTDRQRAALEGFLDTPTACVRDAAPAKGSFPLVIYHSGAASSFEDNAVFCEFLASHGFVVLGSAFQRNDGSSLSTDGVDGSARDLEFLIAHAHTVPCVDWNHIGLVGHSLGAQASLLFRTRAASTVDAVVSLDTTQDYRGVSDPGWEYLTTPVIKNARNFDCPLLMVADPQAFFELADALRAAPRYYLTLRGMGHNDYIAQGALGRALRLQSADSTEKKSGNEEAELMAARAGYRSVCGYALQFLAAELKGDARAREYLAKQYRGTKLGGEAPHVEFTPAGQAGPEPFKDDSTIPPTPRQVYRLLRERGSAAAVAALKRFRPKEPKEAAAAPIFEASFELYLLSDLIDRNRLDEARVFHEYCLQHGNDCRKNLLSFGKSFEAIGRRDLALRFYRRAFQLDPSDPEAAGRVNELEKGKTMEGKKN
jgi:pimeloyl-ACP methyl ester carboxylesterase